MSQAESPPPNPKKSKRVSNFQGVGIAPGTHQEMAKVAKSHSLSNSVYATAAISYFSERGLNPVTDRQREGTVIMGRVDKRAARLEEQITNLGNRLFGFLQTHEKNLYTHLQIQQRALFQYLNNQESSLVRYLTDQETHILAPLLVEVVQGAADAFIARRLGEQIVLRQQDRFNLYGETHIQQTATRDKMVAKRLQEIAQEHAIEGPEFASIPHLTAPPTKSVAPEPAPQPAEQASLKPPIETY